MRIVLTLIAALMLTACQAQPAPENVTSSEAEAPATTAPSSAPEAPEPSNEAASAPPAAEPVPSVPATPDSEKTAAAAKRVLDDYFAALATKQYARAYRLWGDDGKATGMSEAEFAASFDKYRIYDGTAYGAGTTEGGAGSIYAEFPVTVTGILAKGGGFHLSGPMTLRRVNDVDGSTAAQRRWHISASGLKPRP